MAQLQRVTVSPLQIQDDCINLTAEQQHYLGRVLRLQINDRFIAMDGQGQSWLVQLICSLPAEGHQARILEPWATQTELTCPITLLTALPKGNGFEEIVRACTELGVSTFMPVISDRTLLHPSPQKIERWRKIAIEATEQSERQVTPQILDPVSFTRALENHLLNPLSPVQSFKYICGARQDFHLWQALHHDLQQPVQAEIAIALAQREAGQRQN